MKRSWQQSAVLLLAGLLWAQLLAAATHLSLTVDEGFHITSGYEYLRTGRLQLFDEHTPLAKALFAWPLFFVPDLPPPETAPGYAEGDLIQVAQATVLAYRPLERVAVACRVPVALLTVLLAATVYRWAAVEFGPTAGLLALTLFALDPNLLAHGSLATTDLGAVAFIFWATGAFVRYLRRPTRARWALAALLLGLAQGAKLTALLLLPVCGLLWLAQVWRNRDRLALTRAVLRSGLDLVALVGAAALVLWALYGFEVRPLPEIAGGALPLPAASHVARWLRLQANLAYGRESFLLGQNGMHGWWYYFPVAFALKTPLPTLGILLWVLYKAVSRQLSAISLQPSAISRQPSAFSRQPPAFSRQPSAFSLQPSAFKIPPSLRQYLPLLLFPLLYALSSLTSSLNIGYRHLLPIFPFLYVAVSGQFSAFSRQPSAVSRQPLAVSSQPLRNTQHASRFTSHVSRLTPHVSRFTLYALLAWLAFGTLRLTPHYLAFFNELAGGPDGGWRYLADSNTDWGQGYGELARFQQERGLGPVKLSAFVFYDPAAYGVRYEPLTPFGGHTPAVFPSRFNPPPGDYVISATTLDGVPLADPAMYDWFRHREPEARIAHVLFYYHVPEPELPPGWLAQCTTPVAPLTPEAITEGFGRDDLRQATFDCTAGWLYPGGEAPGWFALFRATATGADPFIQARLATARLSYEQRYTGALPSFALYEQTGRPAPATPAAAEIHIGTVTFLGSAVLNPRAARPGATVELETWWRVTEVPSRPLSIMLHLLGPAGTVIVGDGLGVPVDQWQPGDIIVQRHRLLLPPEAPAGEYVPETGIYWAETVERWPVQVNGQAAGDSLRLAPLTVESRR